MHVKAIIYLEAGIITETAELCRDNYLTLYIKQLGSPVKVRMNMLVIYLLVMEGCEIKSTQKHQESFKSE